ncbi:MAG: glycoside hydrolase family 3 C-terminal domain-containing protein [Promethearchaeota archaeon]
MENSEPEYKQYPYWDESLSLEERVDDLLKRLTFEEKCRLSAGYGDNSPGTVERLGIGKFRMTDGPHGVSPGAVEKSKYFLSGTGVAASTYFPTGIQMASTFDPDLLFKFGQALAEETRAAGCKMILGPAFNICRSPMNGRTFEYYSEDPILNGLLSTAAVKGIQSKRISCCIKHFVANNQESNRFKVNEIISRRALEEIYFRGFRMCVENAKPWGLMSSYNKINGTYVSEHKQILREFLKNQWKYDGVVVSDWGATHNCTGIKGLIEAGLDIEMGGVDRYNLDDMKALKESGEFPDEYFEDNVRRILRTYFRVGMFDDPKNVPEGSINTPEHQALARKMAEEGMILLKNDNDLLPLDINKVKKIALLGKHADIKFGRRKLGGGSSAVYPPYEITIREGLTNKCKGKVKIIDDPAEADVAIVCVGLEHTHDFKGGDHEGSDKLRYSLGVMQPRLINKTVKKNKNTIVVFVNGSPFGVEKFYENVPAILEAWYGGMEIGNVVADIIFGDVNPSGKLPVTWPKRKKDIPNPLSFWKTVIPVKEVRYDEGIFIGYRHYEKNNIEPRWCFGFGLSYTKFKYSNIKLSSTELKADQKLTISFDLSNIGERDGDEIAQLYIADLQCSEPRPIKELKGFKRVSLKAGETKNVTFEIDKNDLMFFSENKNEWIAEDGEFEVLIGSSSKDIHLKAKFNYNN